jgi:hypothetical protein
MRDYVDLDSVPCDEDCEQLGANYDPIKAKNEVVAYKHQLLRIFGEPPEGVSIRVKSNPHDFGSYYSIVITFDDNDESGIEWAYNIEDKAPHKWDQEALNELNLQVK